MIEEYLRVLELGYFEIGEAFKGLKDENVWKRPSPDLLSIGELAGHVAFWEAVKFTGKAEEGIATPDLATCSVVSPLVDSRFAYFSTTIQTPPNADQLGMSAIMVNQELIRVHQEAMATLRSLNPDLDRDIPGWPPGYQYGEFLRYAIFHISYHTGQIYTVRHLLGETPPDN